MKKHVGGLLAVFVSAFSISVNATGHQIDNLSIRYIRTVGDYHGETHDRTIELHFTTALTWPSEFKCQAPNRVMVDIKNGHMIAAIYTAFSGDMKVNIYADDSLPIRAGACEISFLDIYKQ